MQNILNINIINYQTFSGKYIEYESNGKGNGKGKEYNIFNDELVFEGEYLNRKKKGIGKEYKSGYLIYEGEYSNGKKNGKGKKYYDNKLVFEGEYLNGKKWNGKGYDDNGNIKYELKDGKGFVKELNEVGGLDFLAGVVFEGEYLNGERNGKGTEYGLYGSISFEGEYYKGKRWNGKGFDNEGNMVLELKNGKGTLRIYNEDKILYEIEYLNGEMNGKFKISEDNGNCIEGETLNNKRHGKIKEYENKDLKVNIYMVIKEKEKNILMEY